jgi:cytosine deaminase
MWKPRSSAMPLDLVLRSARIPGRGAEMFDIAIAEGKIADIGNISTDVPAEDVGGRLVTPGFVETHIHLDKSCILDRCHPETGTLQEAIAQAAIAKRAFTEEDVYERGQRTLVKAIVQGTTRMRTHVEVDPRIGLTSFHAIRRLKRDYAWAVDLDICVFPQEGLLNDPGTEELLVTACEMGADLIGGCPYTDSDPHGQIARIFDIARRFDLDIDFHLDFDLDPSRMDLDEVCRQTNTFRYGGRVAVGHVTKLSALPRGPFIRMARQLAEVGVAATVLPATDLFLMGRSCNHNVPRGVTPAHKLVEHGVTCSLATNNVLNPFTPFGDCSLIRVANLYANIAQAGAKHELTTCFELITTQPAKLMNLQDYGVAVGNPADLVVLDCSDAAMAVAEISPPLLGFKRGRRSFVRPAPTLYAPTRV